MKKISIFLFSMVFFLGINTVSAATHTFTYIIHNENYTYEENKSFYIINEDILSKLYDGLYQDYLTNYSDIYPYYFVGFGSETACIECTEYEDLYAYMVMFANKPTLDINSNDLLHTHALADYITSYSYDVETSSFILPIKEVQSSQYTVNLISSGYFYSNFDLITNISGLDSIYITTKPFFSTLTLNNGDIYPTVQEQLNLDIISDPNVSDSTYVEIDLNQYPYVALSLKDYTKRDTFYTNVYVKGNYCLTPVYNYGMTQKEDVLSGYKAQRCSTYYDNYTLVRTYILSQDIENNAIYYLKAYDTSKDNLVKVDTSIFDITYITEETQENPYVNITDKVYPTIAYDKLTSSATKSEDEDYISGVSCQVGDFNCYNENNPENIFDEVFSSPLNFLKGIWSSITSIFDIIGEFIILLPETMQSFLYLSFMIAVILGLLKIIL